MSIRLRNKDIPNKWYIVVEGDFTNKKGQPVRQKLVKFDGSETEALVADAELNGRDAIKPFPTVLEIIPRFMDMYQNNNRPNSFRAMEGALNHLLPYYAEMRIPLISLFHHETYKTMRLAATYLPGKAWQIPADDTPEESARRRPISKSSINRELACLKCLLTFAEKQGIEVTSRPDLFGKRQTNAKISVPLAPSQLIALLAALDDTHRLPVMLMIYTGMRLKEATRMRCEDVHIENRTMYVIGKGGAKQAVPIPLPLLDHITRAKAAQVKQGVEWIATNPRTGEPYGDITKHLNTLCKAAGIDKTITHHTLRHSCATALVLAGVAIPKVQGILRHANIETTMLYVHIAAAFGASNESELARKLFSLNSDGIEELKPVTLDFSRGIICADSYKAGASISAGLKVVNPANPHK